MTLPVMPIWIDKVRCQLTMGSNVYLQRRPEIKNVPTRNQPTSNTIGVVIPDIAMFETGRPPPNLKKEGKEIQDSPLKPFGNGD